jgi:hypothetical protein
MNMLRLARPLPLSALLLVAACGGAAPPPAEAPAAAQTSGAATGEASAPAAPVASGGVARDPKLAELIKAARACSNGDKAYEFDHDCAGYKAWDQNEELFADGKADEAIFAMFGDPDPKLHYLAMSKSISPDFWKDPGHAKAVFALVRVEKHDDFLRREAQFVARVDAEKAGLGGELKELAKHPSTDFRKELASELVQRSQTPLALSVEETLLADPDKDVRMAAILALAGEHTPPVEPVCQLLAKQITRTDDDLYAAGINAAESSKCPGLKEQALAELDKRTADPAKVGPFVGSMFASTLFGACYHAETPAEKKRLFALGRRLVDPRIEVGMIRERALDNLFVCDSKALAKLLPTFAKDKGLADRVKSIQERLKTEAAEAAKSKGKKK